MHSDQPRLTHGQGTIYHVGPGSTLEVIQPNDVRDELTLAKATVRKLRAERRTLHEMLTEAGIPADVLHDDVKTCLIGRVAVALGRLEPLPEPTWRLVGPRTLMQPHFVDRDW